MATKLKDILSAVLSAGELDLLVGSYDVVGDIAIIIIPQELQARERLIAETILANNTNVKVVAKRAGNYDGEFRTIALEILAGDHRTETLVTEFGVRLRLDVEKTYFSVRSGNERRRIAALVNCQEAVLVMFSGVGPYPLLIARHSEAKKVVGVEKNPLAHEYALKNLKLNTKINNVSLYLQDAGHLPSFLAERFDRIVMPLPTMSRDFLPVALTMLKKDGGWIHYYAMAEKGRFEDTVTEVNRACHDAGKSMAEAQVIRCGHCGPRTYRICVDARIIEAPQQSPPRYCG
jgi:tRNA (guanine37-N1)-methyltransferase